MRQPGKLTETIRTTPAAFGLVVVIALAGCAAVEPGTKEPFNAHFTTGETSTVNLPRASRNDRAISYTMDQICPLSAYGLTFREGPTPVITGTPSESGEFQCALSWYRNLDDPPIDHRTINITIEQGPQDITLAQTDLVFSTLSDGSFRLNAATGGDDSFLYQLRCTPQLPTGIETIWERSSRDEYDIASPPILHGTPEGNFSSTCRYSATSAGETATAMFNISASDEPESDPLMLVQPSIQLSTLSELSFPLADAQGAKQPYTYDLTCTPELPRTIEITWDGIRRNIPPVVHGTTETNFSSACRYTVTSGEEMAAASFNISVSDEQEPEPSEPLTLVQRSILFSTQSVSSFALADAEGGEGAYTYDLMCTPALPTEIEIAWNDYRKITPPILHGTADANFSSACRYTVTSEGETTETTVASFNISASDAPESEPLTLLQPSITFSTRSVSSFALADAEGGAGSYTYDLMCTPALPTEIEITWSSYRKTSPPILHGTADANFSSTCRYTVTSEGETTKTTVASFNISASDAPESEPLTLVQPSITFSTRSVSSSALANAEGGTGSYTYDLICTPRLPRAIGTTWNPPSSRSAPPILHGTAPENFSSTCRYSVSTDTETTTTTFNVSTSDEPEPLVIEQPDIVFSTLSQSSFALAAATGGQGVQSYHYSLECTPDVLGKVGIKSNDPKYGMDLEWDAKPTIPPTLHGTASEKFSTACRYTVASGQETTSISFTISATDEQAPLALVQTDLLFSTLGPTSFALAAATGGEGTQSYRYRLECTPDVLKEVGLLAPDEEAKIDSRYGIELVWDRERRHVLPPTLHGTASENFSAACRYTVTSGQEAASTSFTISATDEQAPLTLVQTDLLFSTLGPTSFALADATGGEGTQSYRYRLECTPDVLKVEIRNGKTIRNGSSEYGIVIEWAQQPQSEQADNTLPPTLHGTASENFSVACRYTVKSGQETVMTTFVASATDQGGEPPGPTDPHPLVLTQESLIFSTKSALSFTLASATGGGGTESYRYRLQCTPDVLREIGLEDKIEDPGYGIDLVWDRKHRHVLPPILRGMAKNRFSSACIYTVVSNGKTTRTTFDISTESDEQDPDLELVQPDIVFSTESALSFTLASATGGGGKESYRYRLQCTPDVLKEVGLLAPEVEAGVDNRYGIELVWDRGRRHVLPPILRGTAKENFSSAACIYTVRSGEETTRTAFNISRQAQQNPVHDALLADYGRRTVIGSGDAMDRTIAAWARSAYSYKTSLVTPDVSTESIGATLGGFDMTGTSKALDVTAVTPVGENWLIGVNTRLTDTESTYRARANALQSVGYTKGDYGAETLTAAPFIAGRTQDGTYAFAGIGAGIGTLYHRDIDSPHSSWREQSTSSLKLRTWHIGGGRPLGDVAGGTIGLAARMDGFTLDARKNAVMQSDFGFEGSTWTAGGSWRHKSLLRPSLQLDLEHHNGDGTYGSELAAGAGIDAAGIGHPRLTITLDARHTWAIDTSADDSWHLRGGLRWGAGEMERGLSADIGTTVHTDDDASMKIFGGEIRWRDMPVTKLGLIELYGGFDQLSGGYTRQRLGLRLPRESGPTIATEAWQEPDFDDFGVRLTLRNEL